METSWEQTFCSSSRERGPLRDRDEVHASRPRPRRALRAPLVSLGHAAQRSLEQLLDPPGAARSAPLHARRQGAGQEGAGRRDGAPAQGGHPRSPGRVSQADRGARGHRWAARGCTRTGAVTPARRVPHRARGALREHLPSRAGGRGAPHRWPAAAPPVVDRGVRPQPEGPPGHRGAAVGEGAGGGCEGGRGQRAGISPLHHRTGRRRRARRVGP